MKRKILFFHEEFPSGGGERVTRDIAKSISMSGYEIYVATCKKGIDATPEVEVLELSSKNFKSKENADLIIDIIHSLSIDIFVLPGFLWEWLGYVKERVKCKFVYILHNMPMWEITAKMERRKRIQGSVLKMLEWYFIAYPQFKWFKTYEKKFIRKYKEVYMLVDAYVVLCNEYKDEMKHLLSISEKDDKFYVIQNAENVVSEFNFHKKKQVIFVGNLIYENKRVDRLLDVWNLVYKKVPDWKLIIVGGGRELGKLQAKARQLNIHNLTFAGGSADVKSYYYDASVSCLTSTFEGWPLCLTEAQANGVIPIAFDCCAGVREILSPNGKNGILIPPFNIEMFAEELYKLLISPRQQEYMRQNVISKAKDYSLEIVGEKWFNLFEAL